MDTYEKYKVMKEKYPDKWYHSSISFGIKNSFKVLDHFKNHDLGYVLIDSNMNPIEIKRKNIIYDSYYNISKINYDKNEKKRELHEYLDKVLDSDINTYSNIFNYLKSIVEVDV